MTAFSAAALLVAPSQAGSAASPAAAKPQRIVSINLRTDQLLVDLVPRDRIAALSHLAGDVTLSAIAPRVGGIKTVPGSAEQVLALAPDLVLTTEYSTPQVVALLKRVGVHVVTVPLASDLDAIRRAVRQVAAAVGEVERGESAIAAFDGRLAALQPATAMRPTALAYQVNSLTAGPGGIIDTMLSTAGYRNMAAEMKLGPAGRLPLETFVTHPPNLIVLANAPDAFRSVTADNLRHPALRDVLRRRPHAEIPMPIWLCGSPSVAEGIERLAAARGRAGESVAEMPGADGAAAVGPRAR
ncbi:MAG: ABC transporter substrate-binding protein [Hyphomicrobiaceae bacterium]